MWNSTGGPSGTSVSRPAGETLKSRLSTQAIATGRARLASETYRSIRPCCSRCTCVACPACPTWGTCQSYDSIRTCTSEHTQTVLSTWSVPICCTSYYLVARSMFHWCIFSAAERRRFCFDSLIINQTELLTSTLICLISYSGKARDWHFYSRFTFTVFNISNAATVAETNRSSTSVFLGQPNLLLCSVCSEKNSVFCSVFLPSRAAFVKLAEGSFLVLTPLPSSFPFSYFLCPAAKWLPFDEARGSAAALHFESRSAHPVTTNSAHVTFYLCNFISCADFLHESLAGLWKSAAKIRSLPRQQFFGTFQLGVRNFISTVKPRQWIAVPGNLKWS